MPQRMVTSIHGRRLGLSSTGGIIQALTSTGGGSSEFDLTAQMWGQGMVATHSSSEATLRNVGTNIISSATAASYLFTMAAPVINARTEVFSQSSATTIVIDSGATTRFFQSTGAGLSTALTISLASTLGGCVGEAVTLLGLSTTRWAVMNKTAAVST